MTDEVEKLIETSDGRLIEPLLKRLSDFESKLGPANAPLVYEACAEITRLSEQNAKLKNTIQDITTYTPEIIQQELAAKDARIAELEVALRSMIDIAQECNRRAMLPHDWLDSNPRYTKARAALLDTQ